MTTTIRQADLIDSVAAALQYISYYHPADFIAHLARAYEREQGPAAKDAIAQILTNSKLCAEGRRPICQDTGIVNVFLKIGMDVRWEGFSGSIADAVNAGVRQGYLNPDNVPRVDPGGPDLRSQEHQGQHPRGDPHGAGARRPGRRDRRRQGWRQREQVQAGDAQPQ
jgi:tartrate dehydratase alpha subunit/fumarate hydratase class I-like protein